MKLTTGKQTSYTSAANKVILNCISLVTARAHQIIASVNQFVEVRQTSAKFRQMQYVLTPLSLAMEHALMEPRFVLYIYSFNNTGTVTARFHGEWSTLVVIVI